MKVRIFLFIILFLPSFYLRAQWGRVGFEGKSIYDICLRDNLLIVPSSFSTDYTVFYGSLNNGMIWDSLGYIDQPWIDEIESMQDFIFCSWHWVCGICFPTPCIFRSANNWVNWDTLYVDDHGASNLLAHNDNLFASLGFSFIKSTDYGNSWFTIDSLPSDFWGMYSVDDYLYLPAGTNKLYRSNDDGISWDLICSTVPGKGLTLIGNNNFLYVGGFFGIARSPNGGIDWELVNTRLPENIRIDLLTAEPNILFASGSDTNHIDLVFCSTNNGENWINISEGLTLGELDWIYTILIKDHYLFAATRVGIWRFDFSNLVNVSDKDRISLEYYVSQNYPNPFNPSTTIKYQIPELSFVTLKIYDVLGNEVATLVNEGKSAGIYEIEFSGSELPSGIYFYTLIAGNFVETKKMILLM